MDYWPIKDTDWHRSTILITGASAGIGMALSREAALRGCQLVLVARRIDRLTSLAHELAERYGVTAHVESVDLAIPGSGLALAANLQEREICVDILINNAGFGVPAAVFAENHLDDVHRMVHLMIGTPLELTHALLPHMIARNRGVVVNVASTAAFQPIPYLAVYSACKSFILSFGESLWKEVRDSGIRVLTVCPGTTLTEFFEAGGPKVSGGRTQTADEVAKKTFHYINNGRGPTKLTSRLNHMLALFPRFMTRRRVIQIMESVGRSAVKH